MRLVGSLRLEQYLREDAGIQAEQRATLEARLESLRERAARAAEPTPEPVPAPIPQPESSGGIGPLGIAGISTLAAGGVSLVIFAVTGGLALDEDAAALEVSRRPSASRSRRWSGRASPAS